MSKLDDLIVQFEKFPGVGTRQAKRFAFHVLTLGKAETERLAADIASLQGDMAECNSCHRFYVKNASGLLCAICDDSRRDASKLLVVAQDSDITPIERSGVYDGLYFVLGGTVPLLGTAVTKKLRGGALKSTISARLSNSLSELILGFSVNPDGENTARYVTQLAREVDDQELLTISTLGRGLSTGSELEYADPETLKNALQNRQ